MRNSVKNMAMKTIQITSEMRRIIAYHAGETIIRAHCLAEDAVGLLSYVAGPRDFAAKVRFVFDNVRKGMIRAVRKAVRTIKHMLL